MSKALFERSMNWRRARDSRYNTTATAEDHIQSYYRYNQLVGESDGGSLLEPAAYQALQQRAAEAATNRLYVSWRCMTTGRDCYNVGPDSRCFCGHSYKAHAW